jgi:hypothetical protein
VQSWGLLTWEQDERLTGEPSQRDALEPREGMPFGQRGDARLAHDGLRVQAVGGDRRAEELQVAGNIRGNIHPVRCVQIVHAARDSADRAARASVHSELARRVIAPQGAPRKLAERGRVL